VDYARLGLYSEIDSRGECFEREKVPMLSNAKRGCLLRRATFSAHKKNKFRGWICAKFLTDTRYRTYLVPKQFMIENYFTRKNPSFKSTTC
jgi:hypothetical protein